MKKSLYLILIVCLLIASFPLGAVALPSDYIQYPYAESQVIVITDYFVDPDDFISDESYEFHGVTITSVKPLFGCETEEQLNKYISRFENPIFPYTITLTSDWDVTEAAEILLKSECIVSAEPNYLLNPKKEPSTEPQYITENLIDFEEYVLDVNITSEAVQEYVDRGYRTSYGIEMPVEVIQSQDEMDAYLTKFERINEEKLHTFASQLSDDYFETYALFAIYASSGTAPAHYYVLGVSSTENKTIIEYEYDYDILDVIHENVILIQVKKSDVKNFDNVATYSTDLVKEAVTYTLPGDVARDGLHDSTDYLWLKRYCMGTMMFSEAQLNLADVNGDGEVNKMDYVLVKRACFGTYVIE